MRDTETNINIDCRISALGIVGDLLKKVGALELKLVQIFKTISASAIKCFFYRYPVEILLKKMGRRAQIRMDSLL